MDFYNITSVILAFIINIGGKVMGLSVTRAAVVTGALFGMGSVPDVTRADDVKPAVVKTEREILDQEIIPQAEKFVKDMQGQQLSPEEIKERLARLGGVFISKGQVEKLLEGKKIELLTRKEHEAYIYELDKRVLFGFLGIAVGGLAGAYVIGVIINSGKKDNLKIPEKQVIDFLQEKTKRPITGEELGTLDLAGEMLLIVTSRDSGTARAYVLGSKPVESPK